MASGCLPPTARWACNTSPWYRPPVQVARQPPQALHTAQLGACWPPRPDLAPQARRPTPNNITTAACPDGSACLLCKPPPSMPTARHIDAALHPVHTTNCQWHTIAHAAAAAQSHLQLRSSQPAGQTSQRASRRRSLPVLQAPTQNGPRQKRRWAAPGPRLMANWSCPSRRMCEPGSMPVKLYQLCMLWPWLTSCLQNARPTRICLPAALRTPCTTPTIAKQHAADPTRTAAAMPALLCSAVHLRAPARMPRHSSTTHNGARRASLHLPRTLGS